MKRLPALPQKNLGVFMYSSGVKRRCTRLPIPSTHGPQPAEIILPLHITQAGAYPIGTTNERTTARTKQKHEPSALPEKKKRHDAYLQISSRHRNPHLWDLSSIVL
jgi:hypothetical protein